MNRKMAAEDMPDNVDLNWVARTLLAIQREVRSLRDDVTVASAILNRIDSNQTSFVEELRAMRTQQERVRKRIESLEQ
jgi:uncharacterized protein (DUF3084 family)